MVRLRLRKVGSKAQPSFRLVAAEREHPRDGRFLEEVGYYNPRTHPAFITVDEALAFKWLKNGAQPTESVAKLFKVTGTFERFERFKKGEALETLAAEAKEAESKRNTSVKTSDAGLTPTRPGQSKKKNKK
jgi:small subunit ribosomal protein S16